MEFSPGDRCGVLPPPSRLACANASALLGLDADLLFTNTTSSGLPALLSFGRGDLKLMPNKTAAWQTTDINIASFRREDPFSNQPRVAIVSKPDIFGMVLNLGTVRN